MSLQSDARYRGISYSDGQPQAQLTLAYDASEGWYGGGLLTQAHFNGSPRRAYMQAYAGRVLGLAPGLDAEAGLNFNHFDGTGRYDYAEAYAGLLGERWNARLHLSNDYYGSGQHSAYAEANLNWPLAREWQAFAHAGLIRGWGGAYGNPQGATRFDGRAGLAWRRGAFELQLAWVAVGRGGPTTWVEDRHRQTVVLGLSAAF